MIVGKTVYMGKGLFAKALAKAGITQTPSTRRVTNGKITLVLDDRLGDQQMTTNDKEIGESLESKFPELRDNKLSKHTH